MLIVRWLVASTVLVLVSTAKAEDSFWLAGTYTQNAPCKGDGSDSPEAKVQISTQEIHSKVGVCTFLDTKTEPNRVTAHVECEFPAGPLMGDITFTMKANNTVAFIDSNKTYTATLYRCPM